MFDGVPVEHYHRFITTPSSRIPPNSPLIQTPSQLVTTSTSLNFLSFDHPLLFPPPLHTHHPFQSNHFVRTPPTHDQYNNDVEGKCVDQEIDLGIDVNDSWSNDEVLQLLRIKSSSENWFKDLSWDHVSRKLADMGYKKSSEKCKEKFEEETCRSFSNTIEYNKSSSSRYLTTDELDEHLCNTSDHNTHHHNVTIEPPQNVTIEPSQNVNHHQQQPQELQEKGEQDLDPQGQKCHFENDPIEIIPQPTQDDVQVTKSKKRKRKHKKYKMVKELCVDLVTKMMAQQEEMHKKLLEDMANREEEKMKREEAWRKEEMERVEREINMREHEHEMAKDRQSTITQFINKITSLDKKIQIPCDINFQDLLQANVTNLDKPISLSEITKIPFAENNINVQDPPISKDDTGKRWPRDEVLALINIRSNVNNVNISGGSDQDGVGGAGARGSLWERISQGMLEMGYKRSAKRCKEKWENINKYFRKTKDGNKKRSMESRTCPYYHELSKLYNQEEKVASLSNSTSQELLTTKTIPEN